MKIVDSWLRDLVQIDLDVDDVAALLTDVGLAVDEVLTVGASVPGVVTARVLRTERHPDAAKVHRVFVDIGDGVERHVWCGAFNMAAGDVIPLATPGTAMPDGRLIEPKPILGIASDGMLCSARELGLGEDHAGILILDPGSPLGVPYGDVLGLDEDVVYDLDVLRNRPDAYGHLGVARDVAARTGGRLIGAPTLTVRGAERRAPVEILDMEGCGRFTSVIISGVVVQTASPDFITRRLAAAGMRSINNVVDVSNYVMLELNQPNHAYDLDRLGGGGFRVRRAAAGETIVTLDNVTRTLGADDLLICDLDDAPIGIAGIMGGLESEISDDTTTVALETAWFEPLGIAAAVQRLGLRSEASVRFERGVDPHGMPRSIARFVELLGLTCPDLVVHEGMVDERGNMPARVQIPMRPTAINAVLGTDLATERMIHLLSSIEFECTVTADRDDVLVTVPSWRPDCTIEVDLAEEIGRLHGFSQIQRRVPKGEVSGGLTPMQHRRRQLREVLIGAGLSEAMPNPFLTEGDIAAAGLEPGVVRIVNSLVADESVLRHSLRPGLLKAIAFNESHRRDGVALFEIGHVYPPSDDVLPAEYEALGVLLAGHEAHDAVRLWREIAAAMGWGARLDQSIVPAGLHPTRSATLSVGRDVVGAVGEVHPDVTDAFGISERVAVLELHLGVLLAAEPKVAAWRPTSRYPSSDMDLAFTLPDDVPAEKLDKAIRQGGGALVVHSALFDVYRTGDGARSLAYRVRLQAADRTLTDVELADVRSKMIAAAAKLGAALR